VPARGLSARLKSRTRPRRCRSRNVTHARVGALARRRVVRSWPPTLIWRLRPCADRSGRRSVALAVAVDAGDGRRSPRSTRTSTSRTARGGRGHRVRTGPDLQKRFTGLGRFLSTRSSTSRPTIARASLLGRACAWNRLHLLPRRRDGDAIRDLQHLVQLVSDEDDRDSSRVSVLRISNSSAAPAA